MLDELAAYQLMDRLGITRAPAIAVAADAAGVPALPFSYPVAVKALSAAIAHKSEMGGVVLNVGDGNALLAAIRKIRDAVAARRACLNLECVLVQPMVPGLGEVLVGYRVDPDVGPLIMVAAGGITTEIYRDRALRLAHLAS